MNESSKANTRAIRRAKSTRTFRITLEQRHFHIHTAHTEASAYVRVVCLCLSVPLVRRGSLRSIHVGSGGSAARERTRESVCVRRERERSEPLADGCECCRRRTSKHRTENDLLSASHSNVTLRNGKAQKFSLLGESRIVIACHSVFRQHSNVLHRNRNHLCAFEIKSNIYKICIFPLVTKSSTNRDRKNILFAVFLSGKTVGKKGLGVIFVVRRNKKLCNRSIYSAEDI